MKPEGHEYICSTLADLDPSFPDHESTHDLDAPEDDNPDKAMDHPLHVATPLLEERVSGPFIQPSAQIQLSL